MQWARRIVGYAIDDRITSHLAVDALTTDVARRGGDQVVAGRVVRSDRCSQLPFPTVRPGNGASQQASGRNAWDGAGAGG